MEMNEQTYSALQQYLVQTVNPATQKQATESLEQVEVQQGFPLLLLRLIGDNAVDDTTRMTGAIYLKNYIKRHWVVDNEEDVDKIAATDRAEIKKQIVQLMIAVPDKLQLHVSDALSLIAQSDFPDNWEELLPELIRNLSPTDYRVNNGVLETAHSIFKRWRHVFRTDALFTEIAQVLSIFCEPYKQLFEFTDKLVQENSNNREALAVLGRSLNLLIQVYYDLNCQDFPEFFEDNLATFMGLLQKYLEYQNPHLASDDADEEGPLEQIKTGICHILELYASRYQESVPQLGSFVPVVIDLLKNANDDAKYDTMVCSAFAVLTAIAKIPAYANSFLDVHTLRPMCETIILPNIAMRTVDEELFEDNPIEYIRRDLEGSDNDTRRRAAADFIRALMESGEAQVTQIMSEHVNRYLSTYKANPKDNWKDKNTAIFLVVAIASRSSNSQQGVTKTNALVNVVDFFSANVLGDLQSDVRTDVPILKVDAIKYVYTFRSQLTKEQLLVVFPLLVKHLESSDYVVYSYAAIVIERILFIRHNKTMLFTSADIKPYAETLLSQLFRLIELGQTPEKLSENDYLMRTVMRVIIISRQDMAPYVNVIMGKLTQILSVVSKNPSNPKFNHYVFESIGALIRFICPISEAALSEFENMCFGPFQEILEQQVQEFSPYVFQLLAQLLEQHKSTELTPAYIALLTPVLNPAIWEHGNIPALVRLVQAYLDKGVNSILANNQLEQILGIFQQKLIPSRKFEHYGMVLLDTIILTVPFNVLVNYLPALLSAVLKKLQSKKKGDSIMFDRFTRNFTLWMNHCFLLESLGGPDTIIKVYEQLQPGLFGQIMALFVLPDLSKLSKPLDRKLGGCGMARLLTGSDLMLQTPYVDQLWGQSLLAVLALIELPAAVEADGPDELYTLDFEDGGYQTAYAKLATSSPAPHDPASGLPAPPIYLAQQIMAMPADKRGIAFYVTVLKCGSGNVLAPRAETRLFNLFVSSFANLEKREKMLAKTLEINWHDGQAIYSVDFSPDGSRYATAGADNSVRIWSIHKRSDGSTSRDPHIAIEDRKQSKQLVNSLPVNIDFLSELKRHSSPVNAVRFSPKGDLIASAGDDACIIIWRLSPVKETTFGGDNSDYEKESWSVVNMFYGHNKEIYDLAWSPCGNYFITASIDNTARVWSLAEKACIHVFTDHTHYVQGVAWDPLGQYVATQSSDRSMAIYKCRKATNGKLVFGSVSKKFSRIDKGKIASNSTSIEDLAAAATGSFRLYHDENLVSFFRRLSFSPDGALLITPAGLNKPVDPTSTAVHSTATVDMDENGEELLNCAYIYPRNTMLKHPVAFIGNHPKPSIAVRWCLMLLQKRKDFSSAFALPYRMLYATATQDSVYIYDTQQCRPICAISGMHFAPITDLAWSPDGSILMFSSADGYCSAAVFADGELGVRHEQQQQPADYSATECDVEMMDIPDTNMPQKRRVSTTMLNQQTVTPSSDAFLAPDKVEKTKKRRITPILISTPFADPSSTPPPPPAANN
ncbi:hypothetical protein [Parasitella parasitica]|uniref:Importin N-terminal domain-containing protein n=1 Tax=Parasitella parasitica TaxID=35722 RepID=A0A0B7NHZ8_9FUNG|nr:hypothetical protein [Parasitella parasitica]